MESKFQGYRKILDRLEDENRFRTIPSDSQTEALIDLCDNDYLGLAKRWREFSETDLDISGVPYSSSASRLLASRQIHHKSLENLLEELYGRPALLFNSGYHTNVGLITALNIPGTIFLVDKLIHASVIDGLSMSKAEYARWRHNDISHLEKLLNKYSTSSQRMIVVAESVYSMDGDVVDIKNLVKLKEKFPSMLLYLDEAHAFGVRGDKGLGVAEETSTIEDIDIIVGTFGKAGASAGAFVTSSKLMIDYFVNASRSFIFSTALPPVNIQWTIKMVKEIVKMNKERENLMAISKDFRNFISQITGEDNPSSSHIVPLAIGDAAKALKIADKLRMKGIRALAIRRPTVPPGGERIRFSLNAALTPHDMEIIKRAIREVLNES